MKTIYGKVGNTRAIFWRGRGKSLDLLTSELISGRALPQLKSLEAACVVFISVVPQASQILRATWGRRAHELTEQEISIKSSYEKGLGIDRRLNIFALQQQIYRPSLVIDFGTAITVDFVSESGRHEGGWILPGLRLMRESLHEKTALLPLIARECVHESRLGFAGKNTKDSIVQAQRHYLQAIVSEARETARKRFHKKAHCILTGGDAILVRTDKTLRRDPLLALKALKRVASR